MSHLIVCMSQLEGRKNPTRGCLSRINNEIKKEEKMFILLHEKETMPLTMGIRNKIRTCLWMATYNDGYECLVYSTRGNGFISMVMSLIDNRTDNLERLVRVNTAWRDGCGQIIMASFGLPPVSLVGSIVR